jgi:cyclopropane-fatty-acyl-phospholipid synthase
MSATTITYPASSFYQRIIFDLLSGMNSGSLTMSLPNGQELIFGNSDVILQARIRILNDDFFKRCVLFGDIGFGESYVEGEWDSDDIVNLIKWFILNIENAAVISGTKKTNFLVNSFKLINKLCHGSRKNSLRGAKNNIHEHYDLSNAFFSLFLDPSMTYSSAYFKTEEMTLESAQEAKYERLCSQLRLKKEDHVLEIGCGWGTNAVYMAKNHGCKVTSVTISEEQYNYARQKVQDAGLSELVTVLLRDYRLIGGKFDKIVSIEMLEAVGADYYETYFSKCNNLLKKDGIFAFQVITCPDSRFDNLKNGVDWIQKHIFPGSLLPSVGAINTAINKVCDLSLVDLKDFGLDYAKTLQLWSSRFNKKLSQIRHIGFDEQFIRKWNYYFAYCEAAFESRNISVMQLTYVRPNNTSR